jgi:hypothetical protein
LLIISVYAIARRSAAQLTPVQLARKRAYDREAQRAVRAKNRLHLEKLERELTELRNNPDREVQELRHRNRVLENELLFLQQACGGYMASYPPRPTDMLPLHPFSLPRTTQNNYGSALREAPVTQVPTVSTDYKQMDRLPRYCPSLVESQTYYSSGSHHRCPPTVAGPAEAASSGHKLASDRLVNKVFMQSVSPASMDNGNFCWGPVQNYPALEDGGAGTGVFVTSKAWAGSGIVQPRQDGSQVTSQGG